MITSLLLVAVSQHTYLKASNPDINDKFGAEVAISGDTIAVGAYQESSNAVGVNGDQSNNSMSGAGAVYVFVRYGATWTQQAYLKPSIVGVGRAFGACLALSDDTLVVGVTAEPAVGYNSGVAYVFVRNGTTWSEQARLQASNANAYDYFGSDVSVFGDTIVVGASHECSAATGVNGSQVDNSANLAGAAYVFRRQGTSWTQEAYLKASNTEMFDMFGSTVAVFRDTIVVGAPGEGSSSPGVNGDQTDNTAYSSGAAYVFVRSGTNWVQQSYLKASNPGERDQFGAALSLWGDTIAAGAFQESSSATGVNGNQADENGQYSGAAYVFQRTGSTWNQQAYIKASNTGPVDYFGSALDLVGDRLVIGALREGSNATGVDGDQNDDSAWGSGAAYIFARQGTSWSQQHYVKATNTESDDTFGMRVGVSGGTVVVGAYKEWGGFAGVNGNQADNSKAYSGAAYVTEFDSLSTSFCAGDGSGAACPCGNTGSAGNGCANAAFTQGARLSSSGFASATVADSLVLTADGLSGPGLFLQGTGQLAAGAGVFFGDGLLCAGGSQVRLAIVFPSNGTAALPDGVSSIPIHTAGAAGAGDVRHYQCWYRDDAPYCTSATFNLTQGLTIAWEL